MDKFTTTPASACRCVAATSTPTRSSRPSTSSASRATGLRGRTVRRLAQRPRLRAQPPGVRRRLGARRRPRLRHRLVARARRVGPAELRVPGRASRRASPTSSAATPARPDCSRHRSTTRSCSDSGTSSKTSPAPRSPSTSSRAPSVPATVRIASRTPSTSTTTPAGGCSKASTTSASRCRTTHDITPYEATRPAWKPATV